MSKKLPSEELSWEEAVARYLEDKPDYFERHTEILANLRIPHPDTGKAISLIERQLGVLRDKNLGLEQQLRELISIARENDVLGERLHRFAGAMIDAGSLDDVLDTAQDMLRQEFRLDAVSIVLDPGPESSKGRPEFLAAKDGRFAVVVKKFAGKRTVCGAVLDADTMAYLFGPMAGDIKSSALVPLRDATHEGLLVLGSRDAHRFHPEMGTVYLIRLGELLMRSAARYLM
jgi:uncharacterized protein YigA (DUF484 family)